MELSVEKAPPVKLKHYRISASEYELICQLLGRPPEGVEWALFSALWSEHCCYKSSKVHLKKFAETLNSTVVNASGENAGVVDLGFGERVVFKMESHNHPSFIEPYQGAATGVGGILRDIFTMGARPIALADYLCFGMPTAPRMHKLVDGVVRGIGGYGNSVGVPTVTGFTEFDESYNQNILVNAMAVGLLRPGEEVALSKAKGVGNWVVYVGAKTGKDGVHGAAMASESFDLNSESKKPNVQIGDPYFEKLLIESCLEVLQQNLVVSIQDMGAAGLTSSSFEMASKGQVGMKLDLSLVPLRDLSMTPEEILLSESQERMLLVCEKEKFEKIQSIFSRWGLDAAVIGEVIAERKIKLIWKGEMICNIDPDLLVENAPQYQRPYFEISAQVPDFGTQDLASFFKFAAGQSKRPVFRQYDQRVGASTIRGAESDVAMLRLPDSKRVLMLGVGCRPYLMRKNAKFAAYDAVLYPALQMAAKGGKALAVTDCLNFGNPEKPEIMSEFVASVEGIKEVAMVFETPVVSGNVSFYNETLGKNITSTPATGLLGIRDQIENIPEDHFQQSGHKLYQLSCCFNPQQSDGLQQLKIFAEQLRQIGATASRVVGRGGLAVTIGKMAIKNGLGFKLEKEMSQQEVFGELFYSVLLEVNAEQEEILSRRDDLYQQYGLERIGVIGGDTIDLMQLGLWHVRDLIKTYHSGILHEIGEL
jgi:phosphoribosylformylglycinamidine synthase II